MKCRDVDVHDRDLPYDSSNVTCVQQTTEIHDMAVSGGQSYETTTRTQNAAAVVKTRSRPSIKDERSE